MKYLKNIKLAKEFIEYVAENNIHTTHVLKQPNTIDVVLDNRKLSRARIISILNDFFAGKKYQCEVYFEKDFSGFSRNITPNPMEQLNKLKYFPDSNNSKIYFAFWRN